MYYFFSSDILLLPVQVGALGSRVKVQSSCFPRWGSALWAVHGLDLRRKCLSAWKSHLTQDRGLYVCELKYNFAAIVSSAPDLQPALCRGAQDTQLGKALGQMQSHPGSCCATNIVHQKAGCVF